MATETTSSWTRIDDSSPEIRDEPWSLYWREFKSGTPEAEEFLHDPLKVFAREIEGVEEDWRVDTHFVNHERALSYTSWCTVSIVSPTEKMVTTKVWKHSPSDE